jgi:hypothetical protein
VAANLFADSCTLAGTVNDAGYNLGIDGTCENGGAHDSTVLTTAELAPLANNGGPTETILPLSGSIGIVPDPTTVTLNGASVPLCPTTDQRGVASPTGAACDAGSVQQPPPTSLYASPAGTGTCLSPAEACTLATALSLAGAGTTIFLTQAGTEGTTSTYYVGNWNVDPVRTTALLPLTIKPEPGVTDPILDGNGGSATNCPTTTCNGSMLTIETDAHVDLTGLTIQHADNTVTTDGGAIVNAFGGTLTISDSTFSSDHAGNDGGAIDNGAGGSGTVTVSDSTFSSDSAGNDGGAIDNADTDGEGNLNIADSTFSSDSAGNDGGALARMFR